MPVLKARRKGIDLRNHPLVSSRAQPEADEMAVALAFVREKPSISYLQRKMQIPYSHAWRLMDRFERDGVVSKRSASGMRTVLKP